MICYLILYINKRKFLRVCVCVCVCSHHYGMQSSEIVFVGAFHNVPVCLGRNFFISLLDFLKKNSKLRFFAIFHFELFFYTLNSSYEFDLLTVCGANISTGNKKRILKINAIDFFKFIFESSATYILQYYWKLWQQQCSLKENKH